MSDLISYLWHKHLLNTFNQMIFIGFLDESSREGDILGTPKTRGVVASPYKDMSPPRNWRRKKFEF